MLALLPVLVPILVVDVLNPVLFALLVFVVGTARPVLNSTALLAGHTAGYFASGVVIALGLDRLTERLANPGLFDFAVTGIVGLALIMTFFRMRSGDTPEADEPAWELTPLHCFGYGAIVNFIGIPFALPYFAAISQILQADPGTASALGALAIYNIGYAAVFAVVPIAVAVTGERAAPFLETAGRWLDRIAGLLMPWLILLLGLYLVVDAGCYFVYG